MNNETHHPDPVINAEVLAEIHEAHASQCRHCAAGETRVRSSVTEMFVHTAVPGVGRVVCTFMGDVPLGVELTPEQEARRVAWVRERVEAGQ